MELTTAEKIRIICKRQNISLRSLADRLKTSDQNLHGKLSRDNFVESDLRAIAAALDCEYQSKFVLRDGTEI